MYFLIGNFRKYDIFEEVKRAGRGFGGLGGI
jgi:hypothetical protein